MILLIQLIVVNVVINVNHVQYLLIVVLFVLI